MKPSPVLPCFSRDVEHGGDQGPGAWVPDAPPRELPRGAARHHDEVLEHQTRGSAHLRVHAERAGGFLHLNGEPVSAAAVTQDAW